MRKNVFLLFVGMLLCFTVLAQQVTLTFTGRDVDNDFIPLDRVVITNVSKNWQETIYYPDTVAILGSEDGIGEKTPVEGFILAQNNPNPFEITTNVTLTTPEADEVTLEMSDMNGRVIASQKFLVTQPGTQRFTLTVASPGTHVLTARQNGRTSSIKMINKGKGTINRIEYDGVSEKKTEISQQKNGTKGIITRPFERGDHLRYVGYVNLNGTEYSSPVIDDYYVFNSDDIFLAFDVDYGTYDYVELEQGGTSITTCNVYITDDGGLSGNYQDNFNGYIVIHPATTGQGIAIEGSYNTEFGYDYIYVYSGADTSGNLLGIYTGSGVISLTSVSLITIQFVSDGSNANSGFTLRATCYSGSSFSCGIVADYDRNIYNTVRIGQQCWMKENLRTTHYYNGVSIALGQWGSGLFLNNRYRYNPDNNGSLVSTYGYLYNWAAVMYGSSSSNENPSGVQGICPTGWHVPSNAEWEQLEDYVSDHSQYVCGNDNDNIAKALASNWGWVDPHTTSFCDPGNNQNANNSTGFSVLPASDYEGDYIGSASYLGKDACFWSTTASNSVTSNQAQQFYLYYLYEYVGRSPISKGYGCSVRCVKDAVDGSDGQPCPGAATVTDIDNNTYNTVQIGSQCWMKENLRTTRYSNGTAIPLGTSESFTIPYRYNPNNDASNVTNYGYLYNWFAVMHGAGSSTTNPSGVQGVCPTGWHVPSYAEWIQLRDYATSQDAYVCGGVNLYIAKALASTVGWTNSDFETCAVGNNPSTNNTTGFSVLPAGVFPYMQAYSFGKYALFSTSTEIYQDNDYQIHVSGIYYLMSHMRVGNGYKEFGYSVRCVRD